VKKAVRTHRLAEDELAHAASWYEAKQPGLGAAFLDLVDNTIERLRSGLLPGSPVPNVEITRNARRVFVQSFPYSIVFYERKAEIVIVAFAHSSRRPGYWRSREL
jgi:toxin ParE1/3/4